MKLRAVVDRLRDRASTIRQDNAVEDITDILRRLPDDEAHAVWLRVGFDVAVCDCGWVGPDCPDKVTAANFWGQHLLAERGAHNDG